MIKIRNMTADDKTAVFDMMKVFYASNAVYTPIATITGGGEFIQMGTTTRQGYIATSVPGGTMTVSMYDDD